jgi:hypothetical protein
MVVGSNPTEGMDICLRLFCVCVVPCVGSGLETADPPSKVQRAVEPYREREREIQYRNFSSNR